MKRAMKTRPHSIRINIRRSFSSFAGNYRVRYQFRLIEGGLNQPNMSILEIIDEFLVLSCAHIPGPHDLCSIDFSFVE